MKELFFCIIFCNCVSNCAAQKNLTNQEIVDLLRSERKMFYVKDSLLISIDEDVDKKVKLFISDLEQNRTAPFLIYSKSYPGSYLLNKPCFSTRYPEYIYIFWKSDNKLNLKIITGNCEKDTLLNCSTSAFDYFIINKKEISTEYIMPVIFAAYRVRPNVIKYSESIIDHEPYCSLIFKMGEMFKRIEFSESDLQNKRSLFYKYNLSLKSFHLWSLLEAQTKPLTVSW